MKIFNISFNKLTVLISPIFFACATANPAATNVRSFSAVNDVAIVQSRLGNGSTRLYSQNSAGDIIQTCVSDAFDVGTEDCNTTTIVPANEVLPGSPIVAENLPTSTGGAFDLIHLFFVSPDNVLSEYIYQSGIGFRGGSSCTDCITAQGFKVVSGSEGFYVLGSSHAVRELRVGFFSQGAPGTVTEAVYDGTRWQTAGLPN